MKISLWRALFLLFGFAAVGLPVSCGGDDDEGVAGSGGTAGTGARGGIGGTGGTAATGGSGGAPTGGTSGAAGVGGTGGTDAGSDVGTGGTAGSGSGGTGSGGTDAGSDVGTGGTAGSGSGGADAGDGGQTCNTIVNTGSVVQIMSIAAALPAQAGGSIAPGKYVLTELTRYTGADGGTGPSGGTLKETIVIAATTLDSVEASGNIDAGLGPEQRNNYAYTAAGTTLALAPACGDAPGQVVQYTAETSDGGLTTLKVVVFGTVVATFTKQ